MVGSASLVRVPEESATAGSGKVVGVGDSGRRILEGREKDGSGPGIFHSDCLAGDRITVVPGAISIPGSRVAGVEVEVCSCGCSSRGTSHRVIGKNIDGRAAIGPGGVDGCEIGAATSFSDGREGH